MEIKIAALLATSVIGTAAFVGCSCTRSVNNDTNEIAVESSMIVSSDTATSTTSIASSKLTDTYTETTSVSTNGTTGTQTSKSIKIQYVGNPGGRTTTTKPVVVTHIVVVTVTLPTTTEETTTTEVTTVTTLATQNKPDGMFNPANDLVFTSNDIVVKVGDIQPSLGSYTTQMPGTAVHGGTAAYVYYFDGFYVSAENMTKQDGASGEFVTEIVINGDNICTNKGIKKGSSIDEIYTAYGMDKCLNEETNIYRYKTDDGYVMEFCTDGTYVTEIKYYMAVESE